MNDKNKENKKEKDLDENELAKSVIDEIIGETEREGFGSETSNHDIANLESSGKSSNNGKGVCFGNTRLRKA